MRLVGWTNVATGEVKSPHAEIRQLHFVSPTVGMKRSLLSEQLLPLCLLWYTRVSSLCGTNR